MTVSGLRLERGMINAADERLLQSPLCSAGQCCMYSMFFAAGTALKRNRRDAAGAVMDAHPALAATAGATRPNAQMVVVRVLAPQMEPAMKLLKAVRVACTKELWGLEEEPLRIWAT